MDAAPLTAAHELARDAVQNAPRSALAAAEKHKIAAVEFAKAAEDVHDSEALRVLHLLEQHHRRLAQIITVNSEQPRGQVQNESANRQDSGSSPKPATKPSNATPAPLVSVQQELAALRPSTHSPVQRRQGRDMSSSIASNLATARGIPQNQHRRTLPPATASVKDNAVRELRRPARQESAIATSVSSDNQSRNPSSNGTGTGARDTTVAASLDPLQPQSEPADGTQADVAFQKFYTTFEGLLTKLSAPLAFAGLPLVPEENKEATKNVAAPTRGPAAVVPMSTTSPDISKIFSKAALQAVKDDRGGLGVQDSFYVVPSGGGSIHYSDMRSRAERQVTQQPQGTALEEGFADITVHRTTSGTEQVPSSRVPSSGRGDSLRLPRKTTEELEIENDSLKQLTDNLSRRLYMWEKSAQSQSMALQQSIRNLQPPTRAMAESGGTLHPEHEGFDAELQEQLGAAQKELERVGRENEKLTAVVMRYRQRWEKLKEGARVRREGMPKGLDAQNITEDGVATPDG